MNVISKIRSSTALNIGKFLDRWHLELDNYGEPLHETRSSWIYLATRRGGQQVILKLLKEEVGADEKRGGALMAWYGSDCAAEMYEYDDEAQLMEYLDGPHLLEHHDAIGDDQSAEVIASVVMRLHATDREAPPAGLTPLNERFKALHRRADYDRHMGLQSVFVRTSNLAYAIDAVPVDSIPLHGDVHHENIVGTRSRAWKVIDPKGLWGAKEYEISNVYCNPVGRPDLTRSRDRIDTITRRFSDVTGYNGTRILQFAAIHAATSACWSMEQNRAANSAERLDVAEQILALI